MVRLVFMFLSVTGCPAVPQPCALFMLWFVQSPNSFISISPCINQNLNTALKSKFSIFNFFYFISILAKKNSIDQTYTLIHTLICSLIYLDFWFN